MTITNFLIGLPVMLLCLIIQVVIAFWCVRYYARHSHKAATQQSFMQTIQPLLIALLILTFGNMVQIALWGVLFRILGEFSAMYPAIYHSAVNFTSLGYGDVVMSEQRKILGPLEAVNGILMLGMSAAALMAILQEMIRAQRKLLESRK
jgi:predicted permease